MIAGLKALRTKKLKKPHFESILSSYPSLDISKRSNRPFLAQLAELSTWLEENPRARVVKSNPNYGVESQTLSFFAIFKSQGSKIYRIAQEFGDQLSKVSLKIENKYLKADDKVICIEFPEGIRFNLGNNAFAHCTYVVIAKSDDNVRDRTGAPIVKHVRLMTPLFTEKGSDTFAFDTLGINFISEEETFETAFSRAKANSSWNYFNDDFIRFVFNSYLYIQSGDPDLRDFKAPKPPTNPKDLRRFERQNETKSTLDMTLVGFNYKKPTLFSKDSTTVSGHWRWQPFGENRARVKLIWIDEHVRVYNDELSSKSSDAKGSSA